MGHAMIHAAGRDDLPADRLRAGIDRLGPDDAERVQRLIPHIDAMHDDGFDRVVRWTIAGLEQLLT
jgi:hypothetical protein